MSLSLPEELEKALTEALSSGKCLVTVSHVGESPPNDLKHFWMTENFPKMDLLNAIKALKKDIEKQELKGTKTSKWT